MYRALKTRCGKRRSVLRAAVAAALAASLSTSLPALAQVPAMPRSPRDDQRSSTSPATSR